MSLTRIVGLLEEQNRQLKQQLKEQSEESADRERKLTGLLEANAQATRKQTATINKQAAEIGLLSSQVGSLTDTLRSLQEQLLKKNISLDTLLGKNRKLLKALFKGSKSEKIPAHGKASSIPPPIVADAPMPGSLAEATQAKSPTPKERGNNGAKRKEFFDLETIIHDVYPNREGFDLSLAQLLRTRECIRYEFIPPRVIKHVYNQHFYLWQGSIISGDIPVTPLLNSNYDASILAAMLQLRYIYSMPVERIVKYFHENGFEINKSTAHGLLSKAAAMFGPMEEALKDAVQESPYLNMDESYYPLLADKENGVDKKTRKVYIWGALAPLKGLVHFFYKNGSRGKQVLDSYLKKDYQGAVQTDGLVIYKVIETGMYPNAIRLSCFQHTKRKFLEVSHNADAQTVVDIINKLYQQEHKITPDWTPQQIQAHRQEYAPDIFKELKDKLLELQARKDILPKSDLRRAIEYALNEYDALCRYIEDPRYKPDNNAIERINRYIALGRKNSLFFASHEGAERGVLYYSLACSCRLNGINTFEYFKDILPRLINLNPVKDKEKIRELLPDKWKKIEEHNTGGGQ